MSELLRIEGRQSAPPSEKGFGAHREAAEWPKLRHGAPGSRNGHAFASSDAVDDVAAVVAQLANRYLSHGA